MKFFNKLFAFAVSAAVTVSGMPLLQHKAEAKSAVWGENFESYSAGTAADSIGWTYTTVDFKDETFSAEVAGDNENKYLRVRSETAELDNTASRVYGVSLNAAKAAQFSDGENFTVEYDLKMDDDIDLGTGAYRSGEYYFGLSRTPNIKGCYMTFYAPGENGITGKTHWTSKSQLANDEAAYRAAVGANTASATVYGKKWNTYKWVVYSLNYGSDNQYAADYAKLYINGEYIATVPIRFGGPELECINFGFERQCSAVSGFCVDNLKIYKGEAEDDGDAAVPVLIQRGNNVNSGFFDGKLYTGEKTVGEVFENLDLKHDINLTGYYATDESGNTVPETASAAGKNLKLETDGNNYSVPMIGNSKDKTVNASDWDLTQNNTATATMTESGGIFGSDSSIVFDTAQGYTGNYCMATSYPNNKEVPSFIHMSVLGKSDTVLSITGRIYYKKDDGTTGYSGGHNLVRLSVGSIYINDASGKSSELKKNIGTYENNEWLNVEVAFFPGQSKYFVRINDSEVQTGTLGLNGTEWEMVKNGYIQLQTPVKTPAVIMGSMTSYTGIPSEVKPAEVTAVGDGLIKTGKTIYTPYGRNPGNYISSEKLTVTENTARQCFTDANGKESNTAAEGGRLVLCSEDGLYSYFDIAGRKSNRTVVSGDNDKTVYWIDVKEDDTEPVIYDADYDGEGKLSSLKTIAGSWVIDKVTFAVTIPASSSDTRKVLIWDKNTLKPITAGITSKPGTIYLVSDSICKTYTEAQAPLKGWGQYIGFCFATAGITVDNRAEAGRSTKTFRAEGRWEENDSCNGVPGIMATLSENDYVFISMGHNDKSTVAERYTTIEEYKENLKNYITDTWSKGAKAVLITPPTERWNTANSVLERAEAMKAVAAETGVTLLDLNAESWAHFEELGLEKSRNQYYCTKEQIAAVNQDYLQSHPNGDLTHFNENGARYLAKTITELLKASGDLLGDFAEPEAAEIK